MSQLIEQTRESVRRADHILTAESIESIALLLQFPGQDLVTPEYGKPEYLLNCDAVGVGVRALENVSKQISELPASDPAVVCIQEGHILMLRWLAHFCGFRHRAIHLFLKHPEHQDSTLLQIRSLSKYNQPGRFDMPVAGHVDGLDSPHEALQKELREELGLDVDNDVEGIRELATYNITLPDFQPNYDEVEHTTVFGAELRPEAFNRIRLQDREVGGLVLFRNNELDTWMKSFPERFGSGLIDSWPYRP